mmetsp:Transcript_73044/g.116112  ORF Transcript_73044/g.116112 Transcript_73044/m.116112 type:complete len:88 (+) Transcript_73044:69-332(+)
MPAVAAAVYEEYLESNMRSMLEALVEALLRSQPEDVEGFSANWLLQWHKEHDPEQQEIEKLRAERDHFRLQRDKLNEELQELQRGAQ